MLWLCSDAVLGVVVIFRDLVNSVVFRSSWPQEVSMHKVASAAIPRLCPTCVNTASALISICLKIISSYLHLCLRFRLHVYFFFKKILLGFREHNRTRNLVHIKLGQFLLGYQSQSAKNDCHRRARWRRWTQFSLENSSGSRIWHVSFYSLVI